MTRQDKLVVLGQITLACVNEHVLSKRFHPSHINFNIILTFLDKNSSLFQSACACAKNYLQTRYVHYVHLPVVKIVCYESGKRPKRIF